MSERRWDLMVLKDFSMLEGSQPNAAGWVPSGLPLHTDKEVLAEMKAERGWLCREKDDWLPWSDDDWVYFDGEVPTGRRCPWCGRDDRRCGWYQIVKETNDE